MEININLIPPYKKEEVVKKRHLRLVINIGRALIGIFLVFFSFLFFLQYLLDLQLASLKINMERNLDKSKKDKIGNYDREFKRINAETGELLRVVNDQLYWTNVFRELSGKMIEGIEMESLATKDYTVMLAGKADNRDRLIGFKDDLAASTCFESVNLPISNLVSRDNVSFQLDIKVKEECLRNKKKQ